MAEERPHHGAVPSCCIGNEDKVTRINTWGGGSEGWGGVIKGWGGGIKKWGVEIMG